MVRQNTTLVTLAKAVSISAGQLSKMLHGRAHIDIEQFDTICAQIGLDARSVWIEAKNEIVDDHHRKTNSRILGQVGESETDSNNVHLYRDRIDASERVRRLLLLVREVAGGDFNSAYALIVSALAGGTTSLSREAWDDILDGREKVDISTIAAIAHGLGVTRDYLLFDDPEVVKRVESELEFARIADKAGVARISARGLLSSDSLRTITELVASRIDKQQRETEIDGRNPPPR